MPEVNPQAAGERLAEWARLAWDQAPRLCSPDTGCTNYHRCWGLVRLAGSQGALPGSSEFLIRELARLAREGARRVLVSGAADTGLMAICVLAAREAGVPLQLVVADRCETPLMQNRIYAQEQGVAAEFHHGDVARLQCEPVDVVIAHSFLLFFPQPQRQAVIDAWARLLKPGGTVLMFSHIVDRDDRVMLHVDEQDLDARVASLCDAAMAIGWNESERGDLAAAVRRFWLDSRSFAARPFVTAANLSEGFEKAGFEVLQLEPQAKGDAANGPVGLATSMPATRAELVARYPKSGRTKANQPPTP